MRRILKWLRSRLALRRMSYAMRTAAEYQVRSDRWDRVLENRRKKLAVTRTQFDEAWMKSSAELGEVRARFDAVWESASSELEEAESLQKQSEHAIESLRNENGVLEKVLVPTLTAAHKLILGRIDADVAVQVRRQVLVAPEEQRLD